MEIQTSNPFSQVKELDACGDLAEKLLSKIRQSLAKYRGIRKPLLEEGVFKRIAYISPHDVEIDHVLRKPVSIFNPGATIMGNDVLIFPRIIPGYFWYASAIGFFRIRLDDLLNGVIERPLRVSIAIYPSKPWDIGGCEDARAHLVNENEIYVLYTGIVPGPRKFHVYGGRSTQCFASLDTSLNLRRSGFLTINFGESQYLPSDWRDSAFVKRFGKEWSFLTRITVHSSQVCWKCMLNLEDLTIDANTLEPNLVNEDWEVKVGWSTNVVELGKGEYIVGWHGVQNVDKRYLNGLAIVDEEGNLKALTNYLLGPTEPAEYYGDRPGVIFGDGLIRYRDLLIWIGGVADQLIGIYVAELDKVLEKMVWVSKR